MKVIFELPDNLLEDGKLDQLSFYSNMMRQVVSQEVKKQLVDVYMKVPHDFGDLGITKEDVKAAVIDKMTERALDN